MSLCLSVTVTVTVTPCDTINTTQARVTKSSLSAPRWTLLPEFVKVVQKVERDQSRRPRALNERGVWKIIPWCQRIMFAMDSRFL